MRILLNSTSDELQHMGGDFTYYRDLRRLKGEGLEFELLPPSGVRRGNAFLRKAFEKLCRGWEPVSLRRGLFLRSRFLYIPQRALAGIDLIFSHLVFPGMAGAEAPIVWSSQGISPAVCYERYNPGQWTVEDVAYIYRVLGQRAEVLIIWTHTCARILIEWCPELAGKVRVVPVPVFVNSRNIPEKPSRQDGVFRLLFVGVDAERKGLPEVLEAFRCLRGKYSNLLLDIVSRPSDELRRKIAALDGATLHMASLQADLPSLMARADIFVMPSWADTYALAAVEAMAYGCAIILSDLEPLPEIAPENEVGFLVPPGDAGSLTRKLEVILGSETLLRRFQASARQRYLSYHAPEVIAKQLKDTFSRLVAGK